MASLGLATQEEGGDFGNSRRESGKTQRDFDGCSCLFIRLFKIRARYFTRIEQRYLQILMRALNPKTRISLHSSLLKEKASMRLIFRISCKNISRSILQHLRLRFCFS